MYVPLFFLNAAAFIVRIKVGNFVLGEPKDKSVGYYVWRRERGYVFGTPKLLAPP